MFGIPTLLATSFGTMLTYVLIGAAILGIAYYLYRRWQHQQNQQQNSEFASIQHARVQRVEQVKAYTVDALSLQQNADQILTGIQQQQTHLESLIHEFEAALKNSQGIDLSLGQTNTDLQESVISPFGALLQKMQTYYVSISQQLLSLSTAYFESNQALVAREKELAQIVQSFNEIESTAQVGISQLNAIPAIRKSLTLKMQKIKELEKALAALTKKTKKLVEINQRQERLIDVLSNTANTVELTQSDRRSSLPSAYKYSNKLFTGQRAPGSGSKGSQYLKHTNGFF